MAITVTPPLCGPQQEYDRGRDVPRFNSNSFSFGLIFTLPRFGASVLLLHTLSFGLF